MIVKAIVKHGMQMLLNYNVIHDHLFSESDGLKKLISLYVCRCFSCWKNPDVMQWLEENVKKVLKRVDANDPLVPEFAQK